MDPDRKPLVQMHNFETDIHSKAEASRKIKGHSRTRSQDVGYKHHHRHEEQLHREYPPSSKSHLARKYFQENRSTSLPTSRVRESYSNFKLEFFPDRQYKEKTSSHQKAHQFFRDFQDKYSLQPSKNPFQANFVNSLIAPAFPAAPENLTSPKTTSAFSRIKSLFSTTTSPVYSKQSKLDKNEQLSSVCRLSSSSSVR